MSREVKRVPLDFDAPFDAVWHGYVRPDQLDEDPCPNAGTRCVNGSTAARAWVEQLVQLLLMLDDAGLHRRRQTMHPYFDSVPRPYVFVDDDGRRVLRCAEFPTPDIAEFGTGLAGRPAGLLGHDAIDRWRAEKKIVEAAGLDPDTWGICPACGGHGGVEAYEGQRGEAEAWQATEPPTGEGWQLWEKVTEGSPLSPVFADAEGLAQWLTTEDGGRAAGPSGQPMTITAARAFVDEGWAPTGIVNAGGVHDGVAYVGSNAVLHGIEQASQDAPDQGGEST